MGVAIVLVLFGTLFVADNKEFLDTVNKQTEEGYSWHYTGEQPLSEPPVPSLPLQVEGSEPYVLWKLKKD
tara:strand:- start:60 stop:269 length:210 start_codon:yes stop_codon:yes gene_type:complete